MLIYALFTILVGLPVVYAGGWDDFSNNLATDLAPFLSLFGEQMTKQYLSESINVVDYFIFAMGPMGILTGVVSAIRVCGTPSLRAFIGRAQEGAGNAEAELCTSTSRDVCELYNSGGIARVFGRPKILEVVHDPDHDFSDLKDDTAGIYTFEEYLKRDKGKALWRKEIPKNRISLWKDKVIALWRTKTVEEPDTESATKSPDVSHVPFTTFAPNLSLNIGIKKQSKHVFYAIALLGLGLQVGVLIFAGFATYYLKWGNDDQPPDSYACPLVIIGTVLVCGGMFHCAFLIGQSTEEDVWRRQANVADKSTMYWIQPGGQIIGDQTFDAFSHTDYDNKLEKYITSRRKNVSDESRLGVWVAIGTTISGFVLQFTGLRGIHSAVSVAQLGIIMVMSMARAMLRMQRLKPKDNCFATFPDEVVGHELDWLALRIGRGVFGKDAVNPDPASLGSSSSIPSSKELSSSLLSPGSQDRRFWRLCGANKMSIKHPSHSDRWNAAAILLAYRTRLTSLTDLSTSSTAPAREFKSEMVEVRSESRQIAALIEATIKAILSKAKVKKEWETASSMLWGIDCAIGKQANQPSIPQKHTVYLEFTRDSAAPGSPWVLKERQQLEGILGLWVWSLKSDPRIETKDQWTNLIRSTASDIGARRIIPTDQVMKPDLEIWLGDDMNTITKSALHSAPTELYDTSSVWKMSTNLGATNVYPISERVQGAPLRFFGWKTANLSQSQDSEGFNLWSAPMTGSLVTSCAQEIFASFLTSILDIVDNFGNVHIEEAESIRLENGLVSEIVALFTEMRLGSKLEALLCVIPLVLPRLEMPSAASALAAARKSANKHREQKDWKKAERVLQWAWNICRQPQNSRTHVIDEGDDHGPGSEGTLAKKATIALCELYRWALIEETSREFGQDGISRLDKKKCDQSVSVREVIDRYFIIANEIAQHQASNANLANMETDCLKIALSFVTRPASETDREQKGKVLCSAAKHGWVEVALALLELGCEPDFRDTEGRTPLSHAVESGNITIVEGLMKWGSFPNSEDHHRMTPLSYASRSGRYKVVMLLLRDARVPPDQSDSQQRTPLSWAAESGHETIVNRLLKTGKVELDIKDTGGRTSLSYAAEYGHDAVIKRLLETGKIEPDAKDSSSRTPLSYMAENGHDTGIKLLLETGKVEPDTKDSSKRTPLSYAAEKGHNAAIKQLLETGQVNPDAMDHSGKTPLSYAAENGYDAVIKQLLETGKVEPDTKDDSRRTPLSFAAENGHNAAIKQLLETGKVEPDTIDAYSRTPLSYAAGNGHNAAIKQLLETGKVEPDINGSYGQTPLSYAAEKGHNAVVKQLLETGKVEPDTRDSSRRTPLSHAAENGHNTIIKQLLETGKVDPNTKDSYSRTPLSFAVRNGHNAIVKQLIETGKVELDTKDTYGRTPLSFAVRKGYNAVVKQLIETGKVEPDTKDSSGRTPLSYMAENGQNTVIKLLLETGKVEPDTKDSSRRTPLSYAAEKGYSAIVKQLLETGKVEPDTNDSSKRTPLSYAVENGHDAVVKRLLETSQVNPDAMGDNGKTPLWYAMKHENPSIVNLIKESKKKKKLEC
ncbi:hypothetical protein N7463_005778 [Penicillium fimorum]|uniref:Ankyrin repeat-containing domain n=1 Tax=Penicillium fimorum TaxID=1882269 RepID=A0A9W9XTK3_9EURO|nr:hypothetical protein N7463_005778 [Penicillium fimorum]